MKIQFYTFDARRNTTFKIAKHLEMAGHEVLYLAPQFSFHRYSSLPPDTRFIGLGDYMKTARRPRLEAFAQNKFGKKLLIPGTEEVLPLFTAFSLDDEQITLSNAMTNGPCNRAAFFFANQYSSEHSAFVHVPHLYDLIAGKEVLLDLHTQWSRLPTSA